MHWYDLFAGLIPLGYCLYVGVKTMKARRPFTFFVEIFIIIFLAAFLPELVYRSIKELRACTPDLIQLDASISLVLVIFMAAYFWWSRPLFCIIGTRKDTLQDTVQRALKNEGIAFEDRYPKFLLTGLGAILFIEHYDSLGTTNIRIKGSPPEETSRKIAAALDREFDQTPSPTVNRRLGILFLLCSAAQIAGMFLVYRQR